MPCKIIKKTRSLIQECFYLKIPKCYSEDLYQERQTTQWSKEKVQQP